MESLRPDRDELDQFRSRNNDKKKGSKPNTTKTSRTDPGLKHAPPQANAIKGVPIWVILLLIVLMAGAGGLGWLFVEQQEKLAFISDRLNEASGTIDQGQLLMARFEGELNETDSEFQQSGSAVEKKLVFLDAEMRKLWAISNGRNKKAIQENADLLAAINVKLGSAQSSQEGLKSSQKTLAKELDQLKAGTSKKATENGGRISSLANEISITRAEQEEALQNLKAEVDKSLTYGNQSQKLTARVTESEQSIKSIDASRRQLNARLVELERQLTSLQLTLKSAK